MGAGHAGGEAARVGARQGVRTAMVAINIDWIAELWRNKDIGGIATKGQDAESGGAEGGEDSVDEGDLGSDDGEIDVVLAGDGEAVVGRGYREGDALDDFGDAGISWCGEDAGNDRA